MQLNWLIATRAGGDACAPSIMVSDYFHSFGSGWVRSLKAWNRFAPTRYREVVLTRFH
jgi:hypothetical protein